MDQDNPETCIRKESEEETGYRIGKVDKLFEFYMSPGAVTGRLLFLQDIKVSEGGGAEDEQENIEVIELDFSKAYRMISTGEIRDAKTIMLLQYAKIFDLVGDNSVYG